MASLAPLALPFLLLDSMRPARHAQNSYSQSALRNNVQNRILPPVPDFVRKNVRLRSSWRTRSRRFRPQFRSNATTRLADTLWWIAVSSCAAGGDLRLLALSYIIRYLISRALHLTSIYGGGRTVTMNYLQRPTGLLWWKSLFRSGIAGFPNDAGQALFERCHVVISIDEPLFPGRPGDRFVSSAHMLHLVPFVSASHPV